MENIVLIILGAETLFLVFMVFVLLDKSKKLTKLFDEFHRLKWTEEEQEKVQREREDYMAMLVHELRSPLSVIKGSADLLIHESKNLTSEDFVKFLSQIKTSSNSLLMLVNDILDVSKIESGKFEVEREKSDINDLLNEEMESYKTITDQKKLKLFTDLQQDIKEFEFDQIRIRQVLNNLLSNAIKFTSEGGEIRIESSQQGDEALKICVVDTGEGIPEELKPKLFHKFVQIHHPNSDTKGTGLGLVICKGIVEAHGGHIWIEDNKPKGTRMCFTLPFKFED